MQATAAGDVEAFGGIIDRNQHALVNFFRKLCASPHDAEDLAQETFLRLYKWRDRYTPSARFATFLYALARHVWVDWLRKKQRRIKTSTEEMLENAATDQVQSVNSSLQIDVEQALQMLSEKLRTVVVMNIYSGLNYGEIAEILDIPVGTVKSRMFNALRQLREIIGEDGLQ